MRRVLVLDSRDGGSTTVSTGLAAHSTVGTLVSRVTTLGSSDSSSTGKSTDTGCVGELGIGRGATECGRLDHSLFALDPGTFDVALVGRITVDSVLLGVSLLATSAEEAQSKEGTKDGSTNTASDDDTGKLTSAEDLVVGTDNLLTIRSHVGARDATVAVAAQSGRSTSASDSASGRGSTVGHSGRSVSTGGSGLSSTGNVSDNSGSRSNGGSKRVAPLGALRKVGSGLVTARRRSDAACRVAKGTELVDGVTETTAAFVLDTRDTRVDVGSGEGAVVGAGVVVVGEGIGTNASLEWVELFGGSTVGGVVNNVFLRRGELVAGFLADEGGWGFRSAAGLERSLRELGAEDGLLPLNGNVLGEGGVASETVLDLVVVVAVLPAISNEGKEEVGSTQMSMTCMCTTSRRVGVGNLRSHVVLEKRVEGSDVGNSVKEAEFGGEVTWLDEVVLEGRAHGTALKADTRVRGGVGRGSS